jgi:hypothetical protein
MAWSDALSCAVICNDLFDFKKVCMVQKHSCSDQPKVLLSWGSQMTLLLVTNMILAVCLG